MHQENLIEQLKNGVRALYAPVDALVSNGAYMVMASLAWALKAWMALLLPEGGRWAEKHRAQKQSLLNVSYHPNPATGYLCKCSHFDASRA